MHPNQQDKIRINKYLSANGFCSRREADRLIEQGRVTINGITAVMGDKAGIGDVVRVGNRQVGTENKKVVLAFYKPKGVVCTEKDAHADKIVKDWVHYPVRVTYAGRLDKDSEGLLLLSNDGDLIQAMMKGTNNHEKEYIVKTDREITDDFLSKMEKGVYLKELSLTTKSCRVEKIGKYTFRIILTQGVNRQIRRMCAVFGYRVNALKRIRVMNIELGDLREGQFRELTEEELVLLYKQCMMDK
ncbi:MAG: pseudouridine synthase [Lachnospiraceae bacterium]